MIESKLDFFQTQSHRSRICNWWLHRNRSWQIAAVNTIACPGSIAGYIACKFAGPLLVFTAHCERGLQSLWQLAGVVTMQFSLADCRLFAAAFARRRLVLLAFASLLWNPLRSHLETHGIHRDRFLRGHGYIAITLVPWLAQHKSG